MAITSKYKSARIYTDRFGNAIVLPAYRKNGITVNNSWIVKILKLPPLPRMLSQQKVRPSQRILMHEWGSVRLSRCFSTASRYLSAPLSRRKGATAIVGDEGEVWLTGLHEAVSRNAQVTGRSTVCVGGDLPPGRSATILKMTVNCQ